MRDGILQARRRGRGEFSHTGRGGEFLQGITHYGRAAWAGGLSRAHGDSTNFLSGEPHDLRLRPDEERRIHPVQPATRPADTDRTDAEPAGRPTSIEVDHASSQTAQPAAGPIKTDQN
jgi:hypothetical protein